jgi:hypothetical protein
VLAKSLENFGRSSLMASIACLNNGVNLRRALDLAVSTFALDHPLPRFDRFPVSRQAGTPGGGRPDERWRKFVGSISRMESFSSKRLTKKFVAKV